MPLDGSQLFGSFPEASNKLIRAERLTKAEVGLPLARYPSEFSDPARAEADLSTDFLEGRQLGGFPRSFPIRWTI